jgi:hypothetical protein
LAKEHKMSDPEFPDAALPDLDYVDQDNPDNDEDEEPVIPRDDHRPTADDAGNDLEGEQIDLDDTLEWRQSDAALARQLDGVDAGDLETSGDLDGPLPDYDALTDDQLSGAEVAPDRTDDGVGSR